MQINLNPTSERGASRDAVNRPRETLGDSHLISSDPSLAFGLVCDLLCCRGNTVLINQNSLQLSQVFASSCWLDFDLVQVAIYFPVEVIKGAK